MLTQQRALASEYPRPASSASRARASPPSERRAWQVLVGAALGAADGLAWFAVTAANPATLVALDNALSAGGPGLVATALAAAVLTGALVVGSVERRVSEWLAGRKAGRAGE